MANFPSSILSPTTVAGSDPRNNPSHAGLHNTDQAEIVALETKVGIDSSGDTGSLDYFMRTGWVKVTATLTYSSADSPTFVVSTSADLTGVIGKGMKMKFTNNSTTFYGFVTAITSNSITLYGGTDYSVANSAITNVFYSNQKAPIGFVLDQTKWTVIVTDTTDRAQASPVNGTWYNPGNISITIPIGCWSVSYQAFLSAAVSSGDLTNLIAKAALSTANNTGSDADLIAVHQMFKNTATNQNAGTNVFRQKTLTLTTKTPYYFNLSVITNATGIQFTNTISSTVLRAICAYL